MVGWIEWLWTRLRRAFEREWRERTREGERGYIHSSPVNDWKREKSEWETWKEIGMENQSLKIGRK